MHASLRGHRGSLPAPAYEGLTKPNDPFTKPPRSDQQRLVRFTTTGDVQLSDDVNDIANADGSKKARYAPNSQMPSVLAGALIGRIGPNGQPFAIGNQPSIVMPASGVLYLGVNDDQAGDNRGNFQVVVR